MDRTRVRTLLAHELASHANGDVQWKLTVPLFDAAGNLYKQPIAVTLLAEPTESASFLLVDLPVVDHKATSTATATTFTGTITIMAMTGAISSTDPTTLTTPPVSSAKSGLKGERHAFAEPKEDYKSLIVCHMKREHRSRRWGNLRVVSGKWLSISGCHKMSC